MAVVAALGAALAYACAMVLQHRGARQAPPESSLRPGLLLDLAQRRAWIIGIGVNVVAFGLRAIALGRGSLVLVQPLVLSGLVVALVIETRLSGRRFSSRDILASAAVIGGVSLFLVAASPTRGRTVAPGSSWLVLAASVSPVVVVALVTGGRAIAEHRAARLAVAGGVLLAATAALTKQVAAGFSHDRLGVLGTWSPYALVVVGLVGTVVTQSAFQAASLRASLPVLNVVEPVASILIGVLVFRERLTSSTAGRVAAVAGLAALVSGVVSLSRTMGDRGDPPPPR
ncbi:MAG: hypothetical protein QOI47_2302 [Actinomycetota bacterium]|nr:hypothetical protein [Actinomycetota bacterium]